MTKTILVVEDDHDTQQTIVMNLEKAGYTVFALDCGENAVQCATEQKPDLILMDIMLPDINGFEVTKKLKENQQTAHIPVVMLTALSGAAEMTKGWQAGTDLYLEKPFTPVRLIEYINCILDN